MIEFVIAFIFNASAIRIREHLSRYEGSTRAREKRIEEMT